MKLLADAVRQGHDPYRRQVVGGRGLPGSRRTIERLKPTARKSEQEQAGPGGRELRANTL
jgi:hypothetical protein